MKKHPIGFGTNFEKEPENNTPMEVCKGVIEPKKSIVQVYFPHRDMSWAYYNDQFDLKVGDLVYVDGKLEGYRGRVIEVNYSFKIKLSDYQKVIAVADTSVKGDFYLAGSHIVSFDKNTIPYSKVVRWFKAPENEEEFVDGDGDENTFPLDDLSKMKISHSAVENGHSYYIEDKVAFIELDGNCGRAIVEGNKNYEIDFKYSDGEISNLRCSCFCSGACKHEFATMRQLKDSLKLITENYEDNHNGYFALISRNAFRNIAMSKIVSGKISVEV